MGRVTEQVAAHARLTGRLLGARDLAGAAATATYFAGIAVVPWLLLTVWTTTWTPWSPGSSGASGTRERWLDLVVLVPPDMGARAPFEALVRAGTGAGLLSAVVLLLPASFWGEGLRRAALALLPLHGRDRFTGWRARLGAVALVVVLPVAGPVLLAVGGALAPLAPEGGGGGALDLVVRVVVGFTAVWLLLAVVLAWVFAAVTPRRPHLVPLAVGALGTASFLAGFLHGFQLFVSLPVDVGLPFAGLGTAGAVVAVGLWLYLLHVVLLVGWVATQALERLLHGDLQAVVA